MIVFDPCHKVARAHDRYGEFLTISSMDHRSFQAGEDAYLISSSWLNEWLLFVQGDLPKAPGPIKNEVLARSLLLPNSTVRLQRDFKLIHRNAWEHYFRYYGGGPVIWIVVPPGLPLISYSNGRWAKSVNFPVEVKMVF
jgi:hypothetical protein